MIKFNPKDLECKKKNHYVWANYLKGWTLNGLDVWHSTSNGKTVFSSVKGVAMERNFYKVQKLNQDDVRFINSLSAESPIELQQLHKNILDVCIAMQSIEEVYLKKNLLNKEFDDFFKAFKNNMIENLYTDQENSVKGVISALASQELSILEDVNNMVDFLNFFGHQITRTKPLKNKLLANIKNAKLKVFFENNWWFVSYIFGMNIGKSLFETRSRDKHCLLINDTQESFLTSDNPILNIHQSLKNDDLRETQEGQEDYFFPISPTVAYMINSSNRFKKGINFVSLSFVKEVNEKMAIYADEFIISTEEEIINNYKKKVGKRLQIIRNAN